MKLLPASFSRTWVQWVQSSSRHTMDHITYCLIWPVNLRGSEALVTPGVGPVINTTAHAFAPQGPAGKPQVQM